MDATETAPTLADLTKGKTELQNELRALRAKYQEDAEAIQREATAIDDRIAAIKAGVKS